MIGGASPRRDGYVLGAGSQVPDLDLPAGLGLWRGPAPGGRGEALAVPAECHAGDGPRVAGQHPDLATGFHFPEVNLAVPAAAGQELAVRCEDHARDGATRGDGEQIRVEEAVEVVPLPLAEAGGALVQEALCQVLVVPQGQARQGDAVVVVEPLLLLAGLGLGLAGVGFGVAGVSLGAERR